MGCGTQSKGSYSGYLYLMFIPCNIDWKEKLHSNSSGNYYPYTGIAEIPTDTELPTHLKSDPWN